MLTNCIKDLLNLKGVIIKSIKNLENVVEIYIEMPLKPHICPNCGSETTKIHDYRIQTIKDIPIYFKPTNLIYNKRRYECKCYNKRFYEDNPIIFKYHRKTLRLTGYIINELRNLESDIEQLRECAKTYQHWYSEIKNSLEVPYSNEPTEGFNNKIKTLKRVSFGIRNFEHLKARILLLNR